MTILLTPPPSDHLRRSSPAYRNPRGAWDLVSLGVSFDRRDTMHHGPGRPVPLGQQRRTIVTNHGWAAAAVLVVLTQSGCHSHPCDDTRYVDLTHAEVSAAGGVAEADRMPGWDYLEINLVDAACQRICPADGDGRSVDACIEQDTDANGLPCGRSSPDWHKGDPLPAGCGVSVECNYQFTGCYETLG
jgi:hypothetical protein